MGKGGLGKTIGSGASQNNFTKIIMSRGWQDPKIIVENVGLNKPVSKIISCKWTVSLQNNLVIILAPPPLVGTRPRAAVINLLHILQICCKRFTSPIAFYCFHHPITVSTNS